MIAAYLDGETEDLPLFWTPVEVRGKNVFIQTSRVNPDLEAQADALLGEEVKLDIDDVTYTNIVNDFKKSLETLEANTDHTIH
ncbi:MAG: hypothetical protein KDD25_07965 [Bdellovibrionales bacterium]|nr:hypothetical protein [Bdellovibrionales bacterium]